MTAGRPLWSLGTPRVVLLHALPFDHQMWGLVRALAADASAPTLYGLGDSVEQWAAAVLDQDPDEELILVGNSVGGSCALEMARLAPERVRGLVLIGTKVGVRPDPHGRDAAVKVLAEQGVEGAWRRYWRPMLGPGCAEDLVAHAHQMALEQDVDDLIAGVRAFYNRRDHTDWVKTWPGHLLLISGAHDRTPTPATAAASAPQALQHIVAGAGHYVSLEQPAQLSHVLAVALQRMRASDD